ncbi:MAG: M24 family metallopeptidase [Acidimicrobiales bacterium]
MQKPVTPLFLYEGRERERGRGRDTGLSRGRHREHGGVPDPELLDRFRRAQRLAYSAAQAVEATLQVGVTERQAAAALRAWLEEAGVDGWFHLPFVWFGERTTLRGMRLPHRFFPTDLALTDGMPYILDCAPVVDGFTADIGLTGCLGANDEVDALLDHLASHRRLVAERVSAGATMGEVYAAVEALAAEHGDEVRHCAYPLGVLAHQVSCRQGEVTGRRTALGFGVTAVTTLLRSALVAAPARRSPLWNSGALSKRRPRPGLWAVEPHLGRGGVGAKFEELLVVTGEEAYWLDDDLPHVARWRQRGLA